METYLVLASMAKPNKATAEKIKSNLAQAAADAAEPIWFDATYFGIAIQSDKCAREIALLAMAGAKTEDLRDLLIVELGPDWFARAETKAANWLTAHVGRPRLI